MKYFKHQKQYFNCGFGVDKKVCILQVDCQSIVNDYYELIELNYKVWWLTDIIPEHK
jgi:hypothetical protein